MPSLSFKQCRRHKYTKRLWLPVDSNSHGEAKLFIRVCLKKNENQTSIQGNTYTVINKDSFFCNIITPQLLVPENLTKTWCRKGSPCRGVIQLGREIKQSVTEKDLLLFFFFFSHGRISAHLISMVCSVVTPLRPLNA